MSALTKIRANWANTAMKSMALALMPHISWRHHGIGVLQGYITEATEHHGFVGVETRLHIWAHELLKPGMNVSGDIHDHRFDMVSHVLCGAISHEEIFAEEYPGGPWSMLALTHARAAKETGYHGPTRTLPGKYAIRRNNYYIVAGDTYQYPKEQFHRSPITENDFAVTLVEKHNQSANAARILYPTDKPPVMAFGHEMDWAIVGPVIERAKRMLAVMQ